MQNGCFVLATKSNETFVRRKLTSRILIFSNFVDTKLKVHTNTKKSRKRAFHDDCQ